MIEHQYVDMDEVRNNPNEKWNLYWLSGNKQLTVKDIENLILPNSINEWNWDCISMYIDIQEVRKNPNKPWNKYRLSFNEILTVKDVETLELSNSEEDWNWFHITINIQEQEIIDNPNKPWHKAGIQNKICSKKVLEFFDAGLLKHLQKNIYTFRYHTDIVVKCEY